MSVLQQTIADVLQTIETCFAMRRLTPCLVLVYSTIDVISNIDRAPNTGRRVAFKNWVEEYLLKRRELQCTGLDLYGARCGMLHSFSAESQVFQDGVARRIYYVDGTADPDNPAFIPIKQRENCAVVRVEELIAAFRNGLADYLRDVERDPERQKRLDSAVAQWFTRVEV